mmetsp:Transcript_47238/g.124609  ORF Transcript_47238/g.124609 Transcript_47238/m.124609 type:complete len:223 (+) Transcript_47238:1470-2138(+)
MRASTCSSSALSMTAQDLTELVTAKPKAMVCKIRKLTSYAHWASATSGCLLGLLPGRTISSRGCEPHFQSAIPGDSPDDHASSPTPGSSSATAKPAAAIATRLGRGTRHRRRREPKGSRRSSPSSSSTSPTASVRPSSPALGEDPPPPAASAAASVWPPSIEGEGVKKPTTDWSSSSAWSTSPPAPRAAPSHATAISEEGPSAGERRGERGGASERRGQERR